MHLMEIVSVSKPHTQGDSFIHFTFFIILFKKVCKVIRFRATILLHVIERVTAMSRITLIFFSLYMLLTVGDAWSTNTVLELNENVQEFNAVMADESGHINNIRFWVINVLFGLGAAIMLDWSIRNRKYASEAYLRNPLNAIFSFFVYLNPFSKRNKPKAVMHYPAMALGLIFIKPFAIANNLSIGNGGKGYLYEAAMWLSQYFEGGILYLTAISFVILPLWTINLYMVAYVLKKTNEPKILGLMA